MFLIIFLDLLSINDSIYIHLYYMYIGIANILHNYLFEINVLYFMYTYFALIHCKMNIYKKCFIMSINNSNKSK